MMKKLFTVITMLAMTLAMMAQDDKPNVVVAEFMNKSNASRVACNNLRQEIVSGLIATDRLTVVETSTLGKMPTEKNELLLFLNDMSIQFYLEGTLNSVDTKSTTSNGKTKYEATINYTLTLIETETGVTKTSETFKDSYLIGDTQDEAVLKAIEYAKKRMKRFVDNHFKVEATIKALDEVDAKKGVKSCYISVGSDAGIAKGQIFEVFIKTEVAGEMINKKVGEVRVEEVLSGTLSKCVVKNGGADMKRHFDAQVKMTVLTRAKKLMPWEMLTQ